MSQTVARQDRFGKAHIVATRGMERDAARFFAACGATGTYRGGSFAIDSEWGGYEREGILDPADPASCKRCLKLQNSAEVQQ